MSNTPPFLVQGATVKDVEPGEYGFIEPKDIWVARDRRAYLDPVAPIRPRDNAVKFYRRMLDYRIYIGDDRDVTFERWDRIPSTFIPVEFG